MSDMLDLRFTKDGEVIVSRRAWEFLTALQGLRDQGLSMRRIVETVYGQHGIELTTGGVWRLLELRRLGRLVVGE